MICTYTCLSMYDLANTVAGPIRRFRIRCLQVFNEDVLIDPRLQNNKALLSAVMMESGT